MSPAVWLLGGLTGAVLGSFVSTAALRALRGQSALLGRSACDGCGVQLGLVETAPILSFVRRGGRCGICGGSIPIAHFVGEVCGAISGVAIVALTSPDVWAALMVVAAALLFAGIYDIGRLRIPNATVGLVAVAGLVVATLQHRPTEAVLTAAVTGVLLAGAAWGFRRSRGRGGLGFGDVKLLTSLAIWTGPSLTPLGVALAALTGLLWISRSARDRQEHIPFAPFIAAAFWPLLLGRLAS